MIEKASAWIVSAAAWLNPTRIRAQALLLALCLWAVCAVDFATSGLFDRAGNIKFQDFLPSYISARLIAQGRAAEVYNEEVAADAIQTVIGQPSRVRLPNLYGPQVGLVLVPLARFSFPIAARIWVAASLFIYVVCIYLIWRWCPNLRPHAATVAISAISFPPLFHFFVRGQTSALVLACFTAAYFAFRADRKWLAGAALGVLFFKPQFLVAIPVVLLLARAWKEFVGLVIAAGAQFAFTRIYFGPAVMHAYFDALRHVSRGGAELSLAPIQMHSLRSFWSWLIPWPEVAIAFYVLTAVVVIALAAVVWKSPAPLAIRFSALTLAAVLVNPHLFVYDLLVLAPVLLLLVDWTLIHEQSATPALRLLLYFVYVLPLFGPLSRWTQVQVSVPSFVALLWILWRGAGTTNEEQASSLTPLH
jgi:glycosyl transferase family 87